MCSAHMTLLRSTPTWMALQGHNCCLLACLFFYLHTCEIELAKFLLQSSPNISQKQQAANCFHYLYKYVSSTYLLTYVSTYLRPTYIPTYVHLAVAVHYSDWGLFRYFFSTLINVFFYLKIKSLSPFHFRTFIILPFSTEILTLKTTFWWKKNK